MRQFLIFRMLFLPCISSLFCTSPQFCGLETVAALHARSAVLVRGARLARPILDVAQIQRVKLSALRRLPSMAIALVF